MPKKFCKKSTGKNPDFYISKKTLSTQAAYARLTCKVKHPQKNTISEKSSLNLLPSLFYTLYSHYAFARGWNWQNKLCPFIFLA